MLLVLPVWGVANQFWDWGNGQSPVGWSIDLHPVQVRSCCLGFPAPFRAVRNVSAHMRCRHARLMLGCCDGGDA
jgi:hypothetical protein